MPSANPSRSVVANQSGAAARGAPTSSNADARGDMSERVSLTSRTIRVGCAVPVIPPACPQRPPGTRRRPPQRMRQARCREHRPPPVGRPRMARPRRALDRPRCPARGPHRGQRPLLRGLRPDRAQPAHGQPGPDPHRQAAPARGTHAVRPRRRRDRHDRRPQGVGRAHPQHPRHGQGLGGEGARPDRAVPVLRGHQRGDDGEQLRLDREPVDDRLPARHRQALPGQPDAGARRRALPARGGDQLHRVQLRAAAVDGLPQPVPRPRRDPPVRRLRPVGQPDRWGRADPAVRRRQGARLRDARW